jgi:hypothetical protein
LCDRIQRAPATTPSTSIADQIANGNQAGVSKQGCLIIGSQRIRTRINPQARLWIQNLTARGPCSRRNIPGRQGRI